jgi:predicted acylesterase/phospholipase RssA
MSSAWVAVAGTLGGAAVGALASIGGQLLQWRRDKTIRWDATRRETYGSFLATSEQCHGALWLIAYSASHGRQDQLSARWATANSLYDRVKAQRDMVELVGTDPTTDAAKQVVA